MIVSVVILAVVGIAFLVPNVMAVRYAVMGGAPGARAASGTVAAAGPRRSPFAFGYAWKTLSPLFFVVAVVLGLGQGGPIGLAIVGLAMLNLIFGFLGWKDYVPGKK